MPKAAGSICCIDGDFDGVTLGRVWPIVFTIVTYLPLSFVQNDKILSARHWFLLSCANL
jgi:hypothetical protein